MENRKGIFIGVQVLIWLTFFSLPAIFLPPPPSAKSIGQDLYNHTLLLIMLNLGLVALFYLNYHVLIPRLLLKKKYVFYVLIILIILGIQFSLSEMILMKNSKDVQLANSEIIIGLGRSSQMLMFLLVLFVSIGIKIMRVLEISEIQRSEIQKEKITAELQFLKAQINPHFLFNTLNSIYSLAIQGSTQTSDALMKLSNMMRYVLVDAEKELVPIEKELTYLENYIKLQKLRLTQNVELEVRISMCKVESNLQISPLILISFIENAFKYGVSTQHRSSILIVLSIDNSTLKLETQNDRFINKNTSHEPTKLGIENAKKRLNIEYLGKHTLQIDDRPNNYSVILTIKLR